MHSSYRATNGNHIKYKSTGRLLKSLKNAQQNILTKAFIYYHYPRRLGKRQMWKSGEKKYLWPQV